MKRFSLPFCCWTHPKFFYYTLKVFCRKPLSSCSCCCMFRSLCTALWPRWCGSASGDAVCTLASGFSCPHCLRSLWNVGRPGTGVVMVEGQFRLCANVLEEWWRVLWIENDWESWQSKQQSSYCHLHIHFYLVLLKCGVFSPFASQQWKVHALNPSWDPVGNLANPLYFEKWSNTSFPHMSV